MSRPRLLRVRGPGRCPACGWHVVTMGHADNCLMGPRAWFSFDGSRLVHNPAGEPETVPDDRYGPPGTDDHVGVLPRTCTACGGYPSRTGSGHKNLCPRAGEVT